MAGKILKRTILDKYCRIFLFTGFFLFTGIFYNNTDTSASEGKIVVHIEDNIITGGEGKGILTIGKNIKDISLEKSFKSGKLKVTGFKVAKGNKYFTAKDDILFNKDKSVLDCYPNAKSGLSYIVKPYVKTISQSAFAYNEYLEDIIIEDGVSVINDNAFFKSNIKLISIPGSVKEIGSYAFEDCAKLESVICKADIVSMCGTFYNCKSLKTFNIPDSVKEIGEYTFTGCKVLKLEIGADVSNIAGNAFYKSEVSLEVDKNNKFYTVIDDIIYSADGTRLEFLADSKREKYTIPDTVESINRYALYENRNIKEITINIKEFNMDNLYGCVNLKKIIFSSDIENIIAGDRDEWTAVTGYKLRSLEDIVIPEGNKYYKSYEGALYSADYKSMYMIPAGRDTFTINENVESIKDDCYCQNNFKSISIPESNKFFQVKDNVLYDKDITKIVIFPGQSKTYEIPATVSDISVILNDYLLDFTDPGFVRYNNAAYNLESVTADGLNSFYKAVDGVLYNKDMTEVILYPQKRKGAYAVPAGIKDFNPAVFTDAEGLTELSIPLNGTIVLNGCASLKKLVYTEGVTGITVYGNWLNTGGVQLEEVYIPGSIRNINLINIGENATVYGYNNTGEYSDDGNPIKGIKAYATEMGYKYKNLGSAPKTVNNGKAVTSGKNIKVSWTKLQGAGGYKISYIPDKRNKYKEIILKNINGGSKTSCTFKKSKLNGKKKIYIRAYKVINGIKIYGKPSEIKCK